MATGTMEVVSVVDVNKNERNWYEIEVKEYDEPLTTKEKKLADAAFAAKDQQIQVQVNVKENGNFTNRFLNDVQSLDGGVPVATTPPASTPEIPTVSRSNEREDTQRRIAAQWAYGRAIELHIAGGGTLLDALDTDKFQAMSAVADALLLATTPK